MEQVLRTLIGVEAAALTFRTKQYSTCYSGHILYEDLCGFKLEKNLSSELLNMEKTYVFVIKPLIK